MSRVKLIIPDENSLKEEELAKKLIEFYGMTLRSRNDHLEVKIKGPGYWWDDFHVYETSTWHRLLFGIESDMSLNEHLRDCAKNDVSGYRKVSQKILDFETLEELELQLTLAGAR